MVQANLDYYWNGGRWNWVNRSLLSNAYAAWYNPNEGWNTICSDAWNSRWRCLGDLTNPDQVFRILGTSASPTGTPVVPTRTPTPSSTPAPTVSWILDDGSMETAFGLNINYRGIPLIAINRFTPDPAEFPLVVREISVLFPDPVEAHLDLVGRNIDLLVYEDPSGSGDPSNATKLYQQTFTVQVADGVTFSNYQVNIPVDGPGDVYVGFSNTYDHGGTVIYSYPAAIDQQISQRRSWLATNYNGSDPDYNDLANNMTLSLIDDMGGFLAGNWLVRASVAAANAPTFTPTTLPVATDTPTSTPTVTATFTPTPPLPTLLAHVLQQGKPAPPDPRWSVPLTLTLTLGNSSWEYTAITTDQSGYFTVTAPSTGTFDWRVKNSHTLANSGLVVISAGTNTVEMGLLREGDANNDNCVSIQDFNILRLTFGKAVGDPNYDPRADFNGDSSVSIADNNLLRLNYGVCGAALIERRR
jgi:hypothetical protein